MQNIIRQPLLHFLLLGALLFALYSRIGNEDASGPTREIVITPGRIQTLTDTFEKVWQRPPSDEELDGLINEFITEEIFYREALTIGLDQDDTIVRRRMRQKMEFITADFTGQIGPTEEDLLHYLETNKDSYRIEPILSFKQVFLNPDGHRNSIEREVESVLATLNSQIHPANLDKIGDRIMLDSQFENAGLREIERQFGTGFGESLLKLKLKSWQGPLQSGYGFHLVFIDQIIEGRFPELDEVRNAVLRDWTAAKTRETKEQFIEALKANYLITIERAAE